MRGNGSIWRMASQGSTLCREMASEKDSPGLMESVIQESDLGTSLVVQWLRLCASNARGMGSTPRQGTKIPYALQQGQRN